MTQTAKNKALNAKNSNAISSALRSRIIEGRWQAGERIPTELELADRFNVCRATINKSMKILEREGLITGRPGRGRFVTDHRIRLRQRTGVIGGVMASWDYLSDPSNVQMVTGMQHALDNAGYHLKTLVINENKDRWELVNTAQVLKLVSPMSIDGVILMTQTIEIAVAKALSTAIPTVMFYHPSINEKLSGVCLDWVSGAFKATKHLIELGHKHIALVTVPERFPIGREQLVGARLACKQCGDCSAKLTPIIMDRFNTDQTQHAVVEHLRLPNRPTAILCGSDRFAEQTYKAIESLSFNIPNDLSIITWNDTLNAPALPINPTAIHIDFEEVGRNAANRLLEMIENPGALRPTIEATERLVIRDSTASPKRT